MTEERIVVFGITGPALQRLLQRAHDGEDPELLSLELYANTSAKEG